MTPKKLSKVTNNGIPQLLKSFGAFDGTREHCDFLMSNGQPILVYPGGGTTIPFYD